MTRFLAGLIAALLVAAPAAAEPPVWVVRDADSEMVLFGSVHVLPPGLIWKPAALDAALARADDLWFELPVGPETQAEVASLAAYKGMLAPGQSLFALLGAKDGRKLMAVADAYRVDKAVLDRLKPWLAEVALAAAAYQRAGADADHGVEQAISASAPPQVKRQALETAAAQLDFFDQTPMPDQLASLNETVDELATDPQAYMKLVRAWTAADVRALDREALTPLRKASPGVYRRLVTDRNAAWTRALDARLKGQGRTVVVVGVGHLVGSDGLPAKLRALGYSVTGP